MKNYIRENVRLWVDLHDFVYPKYDLNISTIMYIFERLNVLYTNFLDTITKNESTRNI